MAHGSICVFPEALAAAADELRDAAGEGLALCGNFSKAATAAGACAPPATEAFQQMQHALAQSLAELQQEVGGLGPRTGQAGHAYVSTDRSLAGDFGGGGS